MGRSLRLNVLGGFEVRWSDGEAAQIPSRKAQALLGFLAAENKRAHSREQLATLLWSTVGDERARHNLRQSLSKIRSCCNAVLISGGDSLAIDAERCAVDIVEFERLANSNDAVDLRHCLDLYRGDLLEGLVTREPAYEEWLLPARTRFRRMACEAADHLIQLVDGQGRDDETIQALNQRLLLDPACEPAHAKLMEVFARVGRRSDALRQFQTCADILERELGAKPSPQTSSLYAEIRDSSSAGGKERAQIVDTADSRSVQLQRPTVAVLPFDNLSGSEDAYFVDGIVEDLITALSRFDSLVVTARGSSFFYQGRAVPDRQIAEELGAQYLVRGSLQRAGKRVRINVQLLDAAAESHLWGARFDREFEDVFVLQDEITSTLVSTLARRHAWQTHEKRRRNVLMPMTCCCAAKTTITALPKKTAEHVSTCSSARSSAILITRSRTPGLPADWDRQWCSNWMTLTNLKTGWRSKPGEAWNLTPMKVNAIGCLRKYH